MTAKEFWLRFGAGFVIGFIVLIAAVLVFGCVAVETRSVLFFDPSTVRCTETLAAAKLCTPEAP